jgi:V/A-type H+-transporting ATPase subunit I
MIEKMKLISLTGRIDDMDRVVGQYLSRYDIHLENAMTELGGVRHLRPFTEVNPYTETLRKLAEYSTQIPPNTSVKGITITIPEAEALVDQLDIRLDELKAKKEGQLKERDRIQQELDLIAMFTELPEDLGKLHDYHFIRYRFGRIPRDFFNKFRHYVYDNFDTIFYRCHTTDEYAYGVYFAPRDEVNKIDAVYSSMHFEQIDLPQDAAEGTPKEAFSSLMAKRNAIDDAIAATDAEIRNMLMEDAGKLAAAKELLERTSNNFDVRKMAAIMNTNGEAYYILGGWMTSSDLMKFKRETASDPDVVCVVEETIRDNALVPPTRLKNPAIFRPYEMYVKMYGLPNYREIDPTIFIALTYSFIFGAMYGDWGQGLVLLIGGALLYRTKRIPLAGIISCAGIFSTFFGLMFGSFFGFEDVPFKAIWLKPKEATMTLPGIGSINTLLVCAVVFGMFLILVTMILNIINAKKLGDKEAELFGTNSITGFIFYLGVIIAMFALFGVGKIYLSAIFGIVFFLIPLALMFMKEPLTNKILKKKEQTKGEGVGMFIVQNFFELFETLLSFFSNTISFVRIGAFAVSHAAMMEVVLMLAGADKGSPNWIAIILGNLFVMGMEGLIVGIQVLRLEYYEMFSRFYKGDGRAFRSFFKKDTMAG